MRKPVPFTADRAGRILALVLDAIALLSLAKTGEAPATIFLAPALALPIHLFTAFAAGPGLLVSTVALCIAGAIELWWGLKFHPVTAAAMAVPLVHALLFLAPRSGIFRGWRMAIGFLELIIAASITSEIYLPVAIVLYIILLSVALSCDFLDRELGKRTAIRRGHPLPPHYIRNSLLLSFLIFLSSAVIFPLLPRYDEAATGGFGRSYAGYSEVVNISRWGAAPEESSGKVMLNLFTPSGMDVGLELYLGLLRSRTLEDFDGKNWLPTLPRRPPKKTPQPSKGSSASGVQIEIVREANESGAFPIPYGTRSVSVIDGDLRFAAPGPFAGGIYLDPQTASSRVRYLVNVDFNHAYGDFSQIENPRTRELLLRVPKELRTERMHRLVKRIFGNARSDAEKVRLLAGFFHENRFTAVASHVDELLAEQLEKSKLAPIEQFLFVTKQGHCEWFASSAAFLLRLAGVPTRLIAGFRVSSSKLGSVLTIRNGDAHAWLEAWIPERGWIPLDPTPRVLRETSLTDLATQVVDFVGAYWYKYVVSFEQKKSGQGWKRHLPALLNGNKASRWAAGCAFAFFLLLIWVSGAYRRFRRSRDSLPAWLTAERTKTEAALKRARKKTQENPTEDFWILIETDWIERGFGIESSTALEKWKALYFVHRFGSGHDSAQALIEAGKQARRKLSV